MSFFGIESFQPYPSSLMHWGLILLLYIFAILCELSFLALFPGGGAASHLSPPLGFSLGFFTLVGELQVDQMSFDPLPSLPRNPLLELCQESVPLMLKQVVLRKHILLSAKCILHCTLPEDVV